jgi:hypothetical protein
MTATIYSCDDHLDLYAVPEGGRRADATSVYVRDPDGNLLEFMIYGEGTAHAG